MIHTACKFEKKLTDNVATIVLLFHCKTQNEEKSIAELSMRMCVILLHP